MDGAMENDGWREVDEEKLMERGRERGGEWREMNWEKWMGWEVERAREKDMERASDWDKAIERDEGSWWNTRKRDLNCLHHFQQLFKILFVYLN
jgi:hypothetical protein